MIKTLFKELKEYKLPSVITPLCMIGEVVCEMIIPIMMARIVDEGIYGGNMGVIFKTGGIMFIIAILGLISGIGGAYFGANASAGFAKNLRKAMFDNIQTFSFANIDKFSTSGLVTRLTTDVSNIQNAYMMMLRMAMRAPASLIIAMIAAFTISPRIARIYLIAVIFLSIIMVLVMGRSTRFFKQVFEKYDSLNESVQENVSAIRVVKAYVREEHENTKFQKAAENIYRLFVRAEMNIVYVSPLMTATVYVCILLVSWVGAHMVVAGDISTGNLMSLLTYCMSILMSLMFLAMIFVMMTMASASGKRIAEVIEEKSSITNKADPVMNVRDGSISFEHVSFAYNEESEEPVLKDINLEINSGETIGIIGGTGSAKSSLVNLISRLYDVSKGTVRVGGVDVRDYDLETLRDQVSVVLQKNVLFSGTVLDNLRWGDKNATEEDCKRACRMACADEFIEKMPDGYNTVIEQGGANVSGGQRQRLCIARALLKKPKILILDDSTSAVDTSTDAKIRKAFAEEIPGTTKLIIAQRISSVQNCNRIIVMDDGKINGFGTHKELIESNDIYREVYESQTGASGDADFDSPVAQ